MGFYIVYDTKKSMKKSESFFEICETIKSEVVENLIKKTERKHEWRRLAELVKYREELRSCQTPASKGKLLGAVSHIITNDKGGQINGGSSTP